MSVVGTQVSFTSSVVIRTPHHHAALSEMPPDGGLVEAEPLGDPGTRPALRVKANSLIHLLVGRSAVVPRQAGLLDDQGDGALGDAVHTSQRTDRPASLVRLDNDFVVDVSQPRPSRFCIIMLGLV